MGRRFHKALKIGAVLTGAAVAVSGLSSALAQEDKMLRVDDATIYRDADFNGPAVNVREAKVNLRLNWRVASIRVLYGRWELCERANFRGRCRVVDRDTPILESRYGIAIQSMRPIGGGSGGGGDPGFAGPSLRGMSSEYFTEPRNWGRRVRACDRGGATAHCAQQSADRFCVTRGWRGSTHESMRTEGREIYLVDVLCTNTSY